MTSKSRKLTLAVASLAFVASLVCSFGGLSVIGAEQSEAQASAFKINDGASVRLSTDGQDEDAVNGIRFSAYVTKAYYDTLLNEYKTCGGIVPGSYDIEHFVKTLDSYWENPNFTTFELPASENWYTDESTLYDYVYLLATASTPERLYLERAVVLPIDEPIIGDDEVDDKVYVRTQQIESVKERVWNDLVNEGFFDKEARGGVDGKFAKALKESLDFEVVTTSSDVSYWGDTIMTYCPPIQFYETSLERNQYAAHAQERGSEQWYYTCMQPQYPYPSHHIDDYLLGSRHALDAKGVRFGGIFVLVRQSVRTVNGNGAYSR